MSKQSRTYRRSKAKFPSARAAWRDIASTLGIRRSSGSLKRSHTSKFWQWIAGK